MAAHLAWVAALLTFVVCIVIYIRQDIHEYHLALRQAQPYNPVTLVTFLAIVGVFVFIATRSSPGTRLASAAVGVVAGLSFFEFPFQLIILVRTYPPLPRAA